MGKNGALKSSNKKDKSHEKGEEATLYQTTKIKRFFYLADNPNTTDISKAEMFTLESSRMTLPPIPGLILTY